MEFAHQSVLLNECIDALAIKPDGIYLDGTLGGAGHSLQICRNLTTGRLIGVDRDLVALEAAKKRLYRHAKKVTLVHDNFENVGAILTALGLDRIDGMPVCASPSDGTGAAESEHAARDSRKRAAATKTSFFMPPSCRCGRPG